MINVVYSLNHIRVEKSGQSLMDVLLSPLKVKDMNNIALAFIHALG